MPSLSPIESVAKSHSEQEQQEHSRDRADVRRVFFLVDSLHVGGTETQAVELARRLDPARYQVTLGCLRVRGPLLARLEGSAVSLRECYPPGGVDSFSGMVEMVRLARFLRRGRFDIVHTHDLWSNLLGIPAARMARVPVVISSRRDLAHLAWYTRRRRKVLRYLQQLSSAVLVNSGKIREQLVSEDKFPAKLIRVIHNGIDVERFGRVTADRERLLPGLDGYKVVMHVGNMHSDIKGQPVLIKAASELCSKFPAVKFVLIGDGARRAEFQSMVAELGLTEQFLFLGQRADVPELLACSDIAVLPSKAEGFPNALLEYMAMGKPTIATNVGGNSEIIEDHVNGLLTPPQDPKALANAILQLLENPALGSSLAQAGRERVRRDFSFERLIANIDAMYTQLLARP
jgi:glycosyltransferase involved in cell wall biosynthesis